MTTDDLKQTLDCYLLAGKRQHNLPKYQPHYTQAYTLWRDMVKEGYLSENLLDRAATLTSDEFVNQEECACLFHAKEAVGLFMFNWYHLNNPADLEHSYFKNYPKHIMEQLKSDGHECVMSMAQLMVHPDWRKNKVGPGVSEILVGFATKRFVESDASALLTFTRNNRKTHELGYRYGGKILLSNHRSHGMSADLLAVYRDTVKVSPIKGVANVVETLWANKTVATLNLANRS